MTDRLKGLTVAFDRDIREDDAEYLINLIRAMKGVADVSPILTDRQDWIIKQRVKREIREKLYHLIDDIENNV